jgi:hypothetical protein
MRRRLLVTSVSTLAFMMIPATAFACGGLIAPDGAVNLLKTTTLAAYHDGIEHYFTAFQFTGLGGAEFGSIVPLPGRPDDVVKAGDWTLQRLLREVAPPVLEDGAVFGLAANAAPQRVAVILETKVASLDITVVKGGAAGVAQWATDQGFALSPDAPEVLDFYAERSPYFMAVKFNAARAQRLGQESGDSIPIQITIPTDEPWVPLRILGLGKQPTESVEADVFLLTDEAPALIPAPLGAGTRAGLPVADGLVIQRSERASELLLTDLHSDKRMGWLPTKGMWFTYMQLNAQAGRLGYDLAIDPSGNGIPSLRAAGFPEGVSAPARNPVAGPDVQIVTKPVPVAGRTVVDRSGWLVSSVLLALLAVLAFRRRGMSLA